jgi:DNA-binding MarR family transcriptional regulator
VPRLDNIRVGAWRDLQAVVAELERSIDEALRADWDISIEWFDVLTALQRLGGTARPLDIAGSLRTPASSISRRLDRLEEEGWVARRRHTDPDRRAVDIELTRSGRRLWREMNVSYRRAVQAHFATHLGDDDIASLRRMLDTLDAADTLPPDTATD